MTWDRYQHSPGLPPGCQQRDIDEAIQQEELTPSQKVTIQQCEEKYGHEPLPGYRWSCRRCGVYLKDGKATEPTEPRK